jgi:hypothetical protein
MTLEQRVDAYEGKEIGENDMVPFLAFSGYPKDIRLWMLRTI